MRRSSGPAAAVVSLAAAVAATVGVRAVAALETTGFRGVLQLPALPRETLGVAWSGGAVWPDAVRAAGAGRLSAAVAALLLAAGCVALLNALVLLAEAGSARRRELAVRAALGAPPAALVVHLLRTLAALLATAAAAGVLLGLGVGGLLRGTWPGEAAVEGLGAAATTALPALLALLGIAAAGYVGGAMAWAGGGTGTLFAGMGVRGGSDPRAAVFRRRALSVLQMAGAGAVTLLAIGAARGASGEPDATPGSADTLAVPIRVEARVGPAWTQLADELSAIPGMESVSFATPGALLGLGVRDHALAQCGRCSRGGLPLPLWGAWADHHAVGPGFFGLAGVEVVAGRALGPEDVQGSRPVAMVNRTFAREAFERGDPLGRRVRVGRDLDAWFEVVGVVEDHRPITVGRDELPRAAVYLALPQTGAAEGHVLLRGAPDALAAAQRRLEAAGLRAGEPATLEELALEARAPVAWLARAAALLALVGLALALQGAQAVALQVTRRRLGELAVRRALGARDRDVLAHVLGGSARTGAWGAAGAVLLGALLVGMASRAAGAGIVPPGPSDYLGVALLLAAASAASAERGAREALRVEPARALE